MRHTLSLTVIVAVALLMGGCKDDRDSLAKKSISTMTDLGKALKSVKDESSSKAAASKVKSIVKSMQELKKKMDAMPKPSPEEDKQLQTKYEKPVTEAMKTVMEESMRIAMDPKLMTPELKAAMDEMKDMK